MKKMKRMTERFRHKNRKKTAALILALVFLAGGIVGISAGKKKVEKDNELYDRTIYVCDEPSVGCIEVTSISVPIYRAASEDAPRAGRTGIYSETYSVYETAVKGDATWYRIGTDRWVTDGSGELSGFTYHEGSDAFWYPPENALQGTYRSSHAVLRLREDGTCTVRDLTGTYSLSSGTYSMTNGNVYVRPDTDSPLMLYVLQLGLPDGSSVFRITDIGELTYRWQDLYFAEYGDIFVKGENDVHEDPETLVTEYLSLALKGSTAEFADLFAGGFVAGSEDALKLPWEEDLKAELFETGIPVNADERRDELNETYGLNADSCVIVPSDVYFDDGSSEHYDIVLVREDGLFHIAELGSTRADPQ